MRRDEIYLLVECICLCLKRIRDDLSTYFQTFLSCLSRKSIDFPGRNGVTDQVKKEGFDEI
jgi:hypothetical protein